MSIGTPAQSGTGYSWSPGGQTTAQIVVSPTVSSVFTVTASTVCGNVNDSVSVNVDSGSASCNPGGNASEAIDLDEDAPLGDPPPPPPEEGPPLDDGRNSLAPVSVDHTRSDGARGDSRRTQINQASRDIEAPGTPLDSDANALRRLRALGRRR